MPRHQSEPSIRGSRALEREFGVPMPGVILPESQWARTALKKVPAGLIDWRALFGRSAPVVIDIGCGNGRSMLTSAVTRPEYDHLGVDILPMVIRYATRRGNQRGLWNTRWAVIGGRELLADHVAPHSVAEIHCYHPQPYYTPEEIPKRLITPEFLALAHRALVPGGVLVLQTDHPAYWRYMCGVVPAFFEFEERHELWPDAPRGKTRREIIARSKGLPIFRGLGRVRVALDAGAARLAAESLPLPTFNAARRLMELDRLEYASEERPAIRKRRRGRQ
jgi:tRNA (guanine-N7-)-methyltransferase